LGSHATPNGDYLRKSNTLAARVRGCRVAEAHQLLGFNPLL
jgi:hypothetical protein